jgi:2-polyprenyl-6-methoxyphenol hydroxylase-like FAD-dependent oxidoreductase
MGSSEHAVVVVGGGPTGMMLAAELKLAGADVVVVERRADREVDGSRARGVNARTLEVLDQRGIVDRFLAAGQPHQGLSLAGVTLDISAFPTRHNYGLALLQRQFEHILGGWFDELGVPIARGVEVVGFAQEESGIDVELSDGRSIRTAYLVGCDGGRSVVRQGADIDFAGSDASRSWLIAEVEMTEEPEIGVRPGGGIGRAADGRRFGVVLSEPEVGRDEEPTLEELRAALLAHEGTDYGAHSPVNLSRFTDMTRQAVSYRAGRALVAGDAAHVHPPQGGQGLNTGVQDAVNLGWKLAQVVGGTSPDSLLDSYHAERHPVGARVLRDTLTGAALQETDRRTVAIRETLAELVDMEEPRLRVAGAASGLGIHYDLGEGHPLLGRRMPDRDLVTNAGPVRAFELLHEAKPVLLELGGHGELDISPWADRIAVVSGRSDGPWELPVLGAVPSPTGVLIRPDGHVAWVGDGTDAGLVKALHTWFGPPGRPSTDPDDRPMSADEDGRRGAAS